MPMRLFVLQMEARQYTQAHSGCQWWPAFRLANIHATFLRLRCSYFMTTASGPALLLILDGWGHRDAADHNAIALAKTPVWDKLISNCPHTLVHTSGMK